MIKFSAAFKLPLLVLVVAALTLLPASAQLLPSGNAATLGPQVVLSNNGGGSAAATTTAPATKGVPVTQADEEWGGCVDPNNPNELVKIGEQTIVCVTISSSADWNDLGNNPAQTVRLSFKPIADEYSMFYVPEFYQDLIVKRVVPTFDGTNNLTIHTASQQAMSHQRLWYSLYDHKVFPHMTVIVHANQGKVESITWDDDCKYCSDQNFNGKCEENSYDFDGNDVPSQSKACPRTDCGVGDRCDLQVGVVWQGTDVDGNSFQSCSRSKYKVACDIPVMFYEGARVANGNHQLVVPRRNVDGSDASFRTSQIKDMNDMDMFYYSYVSKVGKLNVGCGSSTACSAAFKAGSSTAWFGFALAVVVMGVLQ